MSGQGKAQTAAIPVGIARICNAALAWKTRFYLQVCAGQDASRHQQNMRRLSELGVLTRLDGTLRVKHLHSHTFYHGNGRKLNHPLQP